MPKLPLSRAKLFFMFVYILLICWYSQKFDIKPPLKTAPQNVWSSADFLLFFLKITLWKTKASSNEICFLKTILQHFFGCRQPISIKLIFQPVQISDTHIFRGEKGQLLEFLYSASVVGIFIIFLGFNILMLFLPENC